MPKCQTLAKPKIVSVTKKNKYIFTKLFLLLFGLCRSNKEEYKYCHTKMFFIYHILFTNFLFFWLYHREITYFFGLSKKHEGISWSLSCKNSRSNWNLRSDTLFSLILAHFFSLTLSMMALMKKRVIMPQPVMLSCKENSSSYLWAKFCRRFPVTKCKHLLISKYNQKHCDIEVE